MLFDVLANVLVEKSEAKMRAHAASPDFCDASKFMVLRYLTMSQSESVRETVLPEYDRLEKMPEAALYAWLLAKVPK